MHSYNTTTVYKGTYSTPTIFLIAELPVSSFKLSLSLILIHTLTPRFKKCKLIPLR